MVRKKIVYVSPFGAHDRETVPAHLRKAVDAIRWTQAGHPDKRMKSGVKAWDDFVAWSYEQWASPTA